MGPTDDPDAYGRFAEFYANGEYTLHSERMADQFEETLATFDIDGRQVLDVACGEGSFAVEIARRGFDVTGFDISPSMINLARKAAAESSAAPAFVVADARHFSPSDLPRPTGPESEGQSDTATANPGEAGTTSFDVATCWFDSVNHLLTPDDVEAMFERVAAALADDGAFVFDVNPPERLAQLERRDGTVTRDTDGRFEAYTNVSYDPADASVSITITCFKRTDDGWERFDEHYRERGYTVETLEAALHRTGFEHVTASGCPNDRCDPSSSDRVYIAAKKKKSSRMTR